MKALIAHPLHLGSNLSPASRTGKANFSLIASHYELFRKIKLLNGSIIKCGISADEAFNRFTLFKTLMGYPVIHKMVAFEKVQPVFEKQEKDVNNRSPDILSGSNSLCSTNTKAILPELAFNENISFIPGYVCDTIPDYLIENPEERLVLLNLDTTNYESTLTALQFLYPRLVQGGLLLLDYYTPHGEDINAVNDYFEPGKVVVHNFSEPQGIYYIIKE